MTGETGHGFTLGVSGLFKELKEIRGPLEHFSGQSRKLCDVDAVTAVAGAGDDLTQKDDVVAVFPHSHIVIVDPPPGPCKFRQFVVMGRELSPAAEFVVEKLRHRPGDGESVKGARSPADLIKDHKAPGSGVVEDVGRLKHFDHKGTLSA